MDKGSTSICSTCSVIAHICVVVCIIIYIYIIIHTTTHICAITEQVEHMEVLPLSTTDTRSLRAKHNIFPSGVLGHGHGSTYSGADQIRMAMVGGGVN